HRGQSWVIDSPGSLIMGVSGRTGSSRRNLCPRRDQCPHQTMTCPAPLMPASDNSPTASSSHTQCLARQSELVRFSSFLMDELAILLVRTFPCRALFLPWDSLLSPVTRWPRHRRRKPPSLTRQRKLRRLTSQLWSRN